MSAKTTSFSFNSIKGILYQIVSVFAFAFMLVSMRYTYKTTDFKPFEVLIWRSIVLIILNSYLVISDSVDILSVNRSVSTTVFYRCIVGVLSCISWFVSNYFVPPSIVSVILKLNPLLTSLISLIILKEKVSTIEIIGMVTAFAGVIMIIFDPSKVTFSFKQYLSQLYLFSVPLFTALMQSTASVLVRIMGKSLHYVVSPTYLGITCTIFIFPMTMGSLSYQGTIVHYTFWNMFVVFLVGFLGWLGQVTSSRSLQLEKAARINAINFDTVILLLIDVYYFGEKISVIEILGMILIMTTVIGIALLKAFNCVK